MCILAAVNDSETLLGADKLILQMSILVSISE